MTHPATISMDRLSEASLKTLPPGTIVPGYDRHSTRIGIVHVGPGAFHRAHQASYVDALLHTDPRWGICAISLKSRGVRDALAPQDGLYTLTELSDSRRLRVIGAIREVLVAAEQRDAAFARLTAPDTRFVTLTVTEKGYCLDAHGALDEAHPDIVHDREHPSTPRSMIGWLAEGLRRRRAQGIAPFTIISCDNLANNGPTLHNALVAFAAGSTDSGSDDFSRWIEAQVACPRTMVDSITPATDDDLRRQVAEATGLYDAWPIQREVFTQWVIEDLPVIHEADWRSVGATLAADVGVYDRVKLRLLNGAHSTLAYAGLLCGHETVLEAMDDATLVQFIDRLMRDDIAATLNLPRDFDVASYIDDVLARFRNPGVRHLLSQIAWDGSKKLPVRIMATIADALDSGRPMQRLAIPVAAWMRFVARQAKAGVPIVDADAARLAAIGKACSGNAAHDVDLFAAGVSAIPASLWSSAPFRSAVETAYHDLSTPQSALRLRLQQ